MDFGHVFTGILAGGVDIYDDRVETKIITVKRSVPCDVYSFSSSPAANVSDFDGWDSLLFFCSLFLERKINTFTWQDVTWRELSPVRTRLIDGFVLM